MHIEQLLNDAQISASEHATLAQAPEYFHHQPLDTSKSEIHLIRLHTAGTLAPYVTDHPMECEIRNFDTNSLPPYITLSYTWGAVALIREILMNKKIFTVRENLLHFLLAFRRQQASDSWIWIDQLCIDQANTLERNHQVRLMSQIYKSCSYVIVWLDKSSHHDTGDHHSLQAPRYMQLDRILANAYFTHLWIVQEVSLPPHVYVLCGDIWISWAELEERSLTDCAKLLDALNPGPPQPSQTLLYSTERHKLQHYPLLKNGYSTSDQSGLGMRDSL